jgi:chromosome segregation ATPase
VFDFTVKTANMAKHEHEKFIKKWIVDEVQEMMKSMRLYMSIPEKELEKFLNPKISSNPFELHEVKEYTLKNVIRNCNNRDIEEYKALPKEKVIAFKAEKITGSLLLLDNLRKLTEIATSIIPCIAEIEKMNLKLLPEIESHMKNISANIKRLNFRLDEVARTLEPLEFLFESHKMRIEQMRKEINEGREEKERINEWEAEEDYEEKHPYYVELSNKIKKLTEEKKELEKDINRRKNFFKILTKCKKRITKYIKVA